MSKPQIISINKELAKLRFIGNRTPDSTDEEMIGAFSELSSYRDGAVYIGHYAGNSEWERHAKGDEIVFVIEGETALILLTDSGEESNKLCSGELLVVPQNIWHRFETPNGVKVMTVTPQPTDHRIDHPHA